jgi:type I site-specific restriction endonuclease
MSNEADTCRRYVVPRLQAAGWDNEPYRINEQVTFTDGRIVVTGRRGRRRPGKRADYILRYRADFPIAVVEAIDTPWHLDFNFGRASARKSFSFKQSAYGFAVWTRYQ